MTLPSSSDNTAVSEVRKPLPGSWPKDLAQPPNFPTKGITASRRMSDSMKASQTMEDNDPSTAQEAPYTAMPDDTGEATPVSEDIPLPSDFDFSNIGRHPQGQSGLPPPPPPKNNGFFSAIHGVYSTGLDWMAKSMGIPDVSSMPAYKKVPPAGLASTGSGSESVTPLETTTETPQKVGNIHNVDKMDDTRELPEGLTDAERNAFGISEALQRQSIPASVPQDKGVAKSIQNQPASSAVPIKGIANPVVIESAPRPKEKVMPTKTVPGKVQEDTSTNSKISQSKNKNLNLAPLNRVDDVLTAQQKVPITILPGVESLMAPPEILPPQVYKNIISQENDKPVNNLKGPPTKSIPLHSKAPEKTAAQETFVPVALAGGSGTSPLLKSAGVAAAGIAGVGSLVGVVWLFDKFKGLLKSKKPKGKPKRKHGRDWIVN